MKSRFFLVIVIFVGVFFSVAKQFQVQDDSKKQGEKKIEHQKLEEAVEKIKSNLKSFRKRQEDVNAKEPPHKVKTLLNHALLKLKRVNTKIDVYVPKKSKQLKGLDSASHTGRVQFESYSKFPASIRAGLPNEQRKVIKLSEGTVSKTLSKLLKTWVKVTEAFSSLEGNNHTGLSKEEKLRKENYGVVLRRLNEIQGKVGRALIRYSCGEWLGVYRCNSEKEECVPLCALNYNTGLILDEISGKKWYENLSSEEIKNIENLLLLDRNGKIDEIINVAGHLSAAKNLEIQRLDELCEYRNKNFFSHEAFNSVLSSLPEEARKKIYVQIQNKIRETVNKMKLKNLSYEQKKVLKKCLDSLDAPYISLGSLRRLKESLGKYPPEYIKRMFEKSQIRSVTKFFENINELSKGVGYFNEEYKNLMDERFIVEALNENKCNFLTKEELGSIGLDAQFNESREGRFISSAKLLLPDNSLMDLTFLSNEEINLLASYYNKFNKIHENAKNAEYKVEFSTLQEFASIYLEAIKKLQLIIKKKTEVYSFLLNKIKSLNLLGKEISCRDDLTKCSLKQCNLYLIKLVEAHIGLLDIFGSTRLDKYKNEVFDDDKVSLERLNQELRKIDVSSTTRRLLNDISLLIKLLDDFLYVNVTLRICGEITDTKNSYFTDMERLVFAIEAFRGIGRFLAYLQYGINDFICKKSEALNYKTPDDRKEFLFFLAQYLLASKTSKHDWLTGKDIEGIIYYLNAYRGDLTPPLKESQGLYDEYPSINEKNFYLIPRDLSFFCFFAENSNKCCSDTALRLGTKGRIDNYNFEQTAYFTGLLKILNDKFGVATKGKFYDVLLSLLKTAKDKEIISFIPELKTDTDEVTKMADKLLLPSELPKNFPNLQLLKKCIAYHTYSSGKFDLFIALMQIYQAQCGPYDASKLNEFSNWAINYITEHFDDFKKYGVEIPYQYPETSILNKTQIIKFKEPLINEIMMKIGEAIKKGDIWDYNYLLKLPPSELEKECQKYSD